jgi:hypothetical protein
MEAIFAPVKKTTLPDLLLEIPPSTKSQVPEVLLPDLPKLKPGLACAPISLIAASTFSD